MKPGIYMLFAAVLAAVMTAAAGSARAGTLEWLQPPGAPGSPPKKVISLAPSITEILFEVGSGGAVAGATRYDDWPPEARKIKRVGGYLDADIEAIIAMKPDAVFCEKNSGVKNTVEKLASLGIPVGVVSTPDMGSILSATEEIGAAMGRAAAGKQSAASMRARLGAVESAVRGLRRPGVLVLYNIAPP
ncbi:MAG: helical backbone metal receptor, partial [Myxococcota bacterium]